MMGRRLEQYRILASELVKKYDVIVMADFDLRQVKTKKRPEGGVDGNRQIRNTAKIASVGSMRKEIVRACSESGKIFEKVGPANITRECPFCGGRIEGSPRAYITVTCGDCGRMYDQDWAGANNILKKVVRSTHEGFLRTPQSLPGNGRSANG
jgi:transposase